MAIEAMVGDTEFWLLAKRVVLSGGTVQSTDTVFSLQAKLTDAMGTGSGTGGGIPEAPTDGQLYGRQSAAWAVVPAAGGGGSFDAKTVRFFDDFDADINGVTALGQWKLSGGASGVSLVPSSAHENGIWQISTGSLGINFASARAPILLGTNTVSCRWRIMIPTLPSGSDHLLYCFGLLSGVPGADAIDVAFGYDSSTSPNWRTRQSNIDTGVAVTAGAWYDLIIVTDPVNSTYFIGKNNAAPAQVAQIPTSAYGSSAVAAYAGGYVYSGNLVYNVDCYEQKIAWPANRLLLG